MNNQHTPVMLSEVMDLLKLQPGGKAIDCTLGGGGYTLEIAKAVGPSGQVIAIDLDPLAIDYVKKSLAAKKLKQAELVEGNFADLADLVGKSLDSRLRGNKFNAIVFDLGLSTTQLQDPARGFSFLFDRSLDMAFGPGQQSTIKIVNQSSERELGRIISQFGQERFYKNIARKIVAARQIKPITSTGQLVEIIKSAIPPSARRGKIHFATKTFQALRIATNQELDNLRAALPQALALLAKGGRLAVVSFHSLEDRIVKNFFKTEIRDCICPPRLPHCVCHHQAQLKIITKKPLTPNLPETRRNPRARSAKLRVAAKL